MEYFQFLLRKGCSINAVGFYSHYPELEVYYKANCLTLAVGHGHLNIVKFILSSFHSQPSAQFVEFNNVINFQIIEKCKKESPRSLASNVRFKGFTPLMIACISLSSNLEIVKLLFKHNASFEVPKNRSGDNFLHYCATNRENLDIVQFIFRHSGINIQSKNRNGLTPRDIAKEIGNQAVVDIIEETQIEMQKEK